MGGTAILLRGTPDADRLARRGLLARIFRTGGLREAQLGPNRTLLELPSDNVKAVVPAFESYIRRKVGTPWPATKSVLDYLDFAISLYVRGEREGDATAEWYVQLTFSGCAGQAETSAELAAHWATRWWADERAEITRLLAAGGFSATHLDDPDDEVTFLPLGSLGYASFRKAGFWVDDEAPPTHFEIDTAVAEELDDDGEALVEALEGQWVSLMSDGRCHCQLCDPGFDHARLTSLPLDDA